MSLLVHEEGAVNALSFAARSWTRFFTCLLLRALSSCVIILLSVVLPPSHLIARFSASYLDLSVSVSFFSSSSTQSSHSLLKNTTRGMHAVVLPAYTTIIYLSHHKQRPRRPTLHSHRTSPLSTPYISSPRAFSALSNKKHTTLHPTLHPEPQSCTRTRTRTQPNRPPRTRAPQD